MKFAADFIKLPGERFLTMKLNGLLLELVVCCLFVGCSSSVAPPLPVFKVTGKVTYKGEPVVGADIMFRCDEVNRSAFGRTNAEGVYKLTTFSANDGAVAGKHGVSIVLVPPSTPTAPIASIESDDYAPPGEGESTDPQPVASTLPETYKDPATSGLIAVIEAGRENVQNFDLE